ncbi:MAG: energy transducer TonB [Terracidiphilus sp.]
MNSAATCARLGVPAFCGALALVLLLAASIPGAVTAQQAAPASSHDNQPAALEPSAAQTPQAAPAPAPPDTPAESQPTPPPTPPHPATASSVPQSAASGGITEDELRSLLVGKELFLRGGYLDNTLSFNEHGVLIGHSSEGSYTLCGIRIDKVRLTKHKVELEGQRFGLHFLGALPYEDPTKAVDRVNITPRKKVVKITIDREIVVKPKQKKEKGKSAKNAAKAAPIASVPAAGPPAAASGQPAEASEAQAEIAAAPPAEPPADAKSVTTTTSPAHAAKVLEDALDNVFAQGFDSRMMASMRGFWKLYYEAAAAKTDYHPQDPSVLRESMVDTKARLVTTFEPPSNQYAQDHDIAGMCLYHVVIGADGKPGEIAVARPIGFGLDENAVDSIRKALFEPAIKDGKPVPVMLDLVVEFRIYSMRTAVTAPQSNQPAGASLPGPYSVQH